uniref:Flp pilus assembly protein CpaB n=1 Tax=Thaumasiovibrio occultus TaxID=1891184 RepID=UPI000B34FBBF|nr:Flp pilus assembly protein CpaB [Thaumasiovibrio occultus]
MGRGIILLVAFLAIGVGVYGLTGNLFTPPEAQVQVQHVEPEAPPVPMVSVWAFNRNLLYKDAISGADLGRISVPEPQMEAQGWIPTTEPLPAIFPGSVAAERLIEGQPFESHHLISPDSPEFIDVMIDPGFIPYTYLANIEAVYGGVIKAGDYVDIVTLTSLQQNLAHGEVMTDFRGVSVHPLLVRRRVLQVERLKAEEKPRSQVNVVLELTKEDVAKMVIAKRIGVLELHKSMTEGPQHQADTGDVLPDFFSVTELRGNERVIN